MDRLLAIAMREIRQTQDEFRSIAGRLDSGYPMEAWRKTRLQHPARRAG